MLESNVLTHLNTLPCCQTSSPLSSLLFAIPFQAQPSLPTHHCHCSHCTLHKFPKLCLHKEAQSGTPTWHRIRTTVEHRVWIKNWQLYQIYTIYCRWGMHFATSPEEWRGCTIPISSSCLAADFWTMIDLLSMCRNVSCFKPAVFAGLYMPMPSFGWLNLVL